MYHYEKEETRGRQKPFCSGEGDRGLCEGTKLGKREKKNNYYETA